MQKLKSSFVLRQSFLSIVLLIILHKILHCDGYNYCYGKAEKDLCGQKKHLMCHKNLLPKQGDLVKLLPMTKKIKSKILDMHNNFRNRIASGNETGKGGELYPKASRMREVLWDKELAYIAGRHARHCSFKHDSCRNTYRFKHSGQNLGKGTLSGKIKLSSIIGVLNSMFDEKNLVDSPKDLPKKFDNSASAAGHFTVIVNERSSFLGCGIALCKNSGAKKIGFYLLTCNYEYTNMFDATIYKTDDMESASACGDWKTEKSKKYKHLCKNNGKIYT